MLTVERRGIEIIGMISTTLASELYGRSIIAGAVDPAFIARFAQRPRRGRLRSRAGWLRLDRRRRLRGHRACGGGHDAARLPHRASSGIRGADARRAQGGHARPRHRRPHRPAHHHGRQRCRAAARRRLPRPRCAVSAHRRVPRSATAHVGEREAVRLRRRVLSGARCVLRGETVAAPGDSDLLRRRLGPRPDGRREAL